MNIKIYHLDGLYVIKYAFKPGHVDYEKSFNQATDAIQFLELLYHNYFVTTSMGLL